MKYRIPYKIQGKDAQNKAVVYCYATGQQNTIETVIPGPGARVIELEALTHKAAARKLAQLVLPEDPRPVRSTHWIKYFVIGD